MTTSPSDDPRPPPARPGGVSTGIGGPNEIFVGAPDAGRIDPIEDRLIKGPPGAARLTRPPHDLREGGPAFVGFDRILNVILTGTLASRGETVPLVADPAGGSRR